MMKAMTGKERIIAAMRREDVDFVPCVVSFNNQDSVQRIGKRWQFPWGPTQLEMLEYTTRYYGTDHIIWGPFEFCQRPEAKSKVWLKNDEVLFKEWQTPVGSIRCGVRYNQLWPHGFDIPIFSDYTVGHCVEPWIKTLNDVECLNYILSYPQGSQLDDFYTNIANVKKLATQYQMPLGCYFGRGMTGAGNFFGVENSCILAIENPELLRRYIAIEHQTILKMYELGLEIGVDIFGRNGFYESADLYSPAILQELLHQPLSEEIDLVHRNNRVILYTMLSGYIPILDNLLALNFDALSAVDIFLQHGNGHKVKAKLGDKMAFFTGPSDTIHLPYDDSEATREAVRNVFDIFGKKGLLLSCCSSSKAVFPWGNMEAMFDEWKKLR